MSERSATEVKLVSVVTDPRACLHTTSNAIVIDLVPRIPPTPDMDPLKPIFIWTYSAGVDYSTSSTARDFKPQRARTKYTVVRALVHLGYSLPVAALKFAECTTSTSPVPNVDVYR